jgi:hypothetical protein
MMIETLKSVLNSQYEASLCTMAHCVERCPDAFWNARVAKYPFCQVAFHALFFADYFLGADAESFPRQEFHLAHPTFFGDYEQLEDREPRSLYDRPALVTYLEFCRHKAAATMAAETEQTLCALAKFPRRNIPRAELHVRNIRHIQHHAAQLTLRLRLDTEVDIPWIGSGWVGPAPLRA